MLLYPELSGEKFMKKMVYLVLLFGFCFFGCATTPKINIKKLNSKNFALNSIELIIYGYRESMDVKTIFQKLPIKDVVENISAKHGIQIDTTFFDDETFVENIGQKSLISENKKIALPDWIIENELSQNQICDIKFVLNVTAQAGQIGMNANVTTKVLDENKTYLISSRDQIKYNGWTPDK
jgi:hypothetical protein